MLKSILIAGQATYSGNGQSLDPCGKVNFIFGTNGSGKTTISRVIADPDKYPSCQLTWDGGREVERLVYNCDFVELNFSTNLKGIFTLGEESAETLKQIEKTKDELQKHQQALTSLENELSGKDGNSGKLGELKRLRRAFEETCWLIKNRHDAHFQQVFEGMRNSKTKFCDKVLSEKIENTAILCELDDLKARAKSVFQKGLARLNPIIIPNFTDLIELEQASILAKKVVGKEDVNVAALISHLGNSDWVKQGRTYLGHSGTVCPFCQQQLLRDLARDLDDYFDESFTRDLAEIEKLQAAYETYSSAVLHRLKEIVAAGGAHVPIDELQVDIDRLAQRIELNKRHIGQKKAEPSANVALERLGEVISGIVERLTSSNDKVKKHNALVENISEEQERLIAEAWRFVLNESQAAIDGYLNDKRQLDDAVTGINSAIENRKAQLGEAEAEIAALERSITSVEPTINEINGILSSFGFTSFKLAAAGEEGNLYKLVRDDGSDALKTLSEGEKSFITFLYFYHLIRGSVSASGVTTDRVVVFDDPVSSLDSDVLFIVSSLIKSVLDDAYSGRNQVKQAFILTHNIYFHKEVSLDPGRGKGRRRGEKNFWIVRKQDNESVLKYYDHNPIKSAYELLWSEVRSADRSKLTIQNTLRRIIESYFTLLGNMDKDAIISKFEGRERQICASLFSWVNDGSHAVHDELYVSLDDGVVERYLEVFKKIFEQTNHLGHYEMMMGSTGRLLEQAENSVVPAV